LVTSNADSGPGTLRDLLDNCADGDTIVFDNSLLGQIITLNSELQINCDVIIAGLGGSNSVVTGNNNSRVFKIASGKSVLIQGMQIVQGLANGAGADANGGCICNEGDLTLDDVKVLGCVATGNGGAIYTTGPVNATETVIKSSIAANGAGIYTDGGAITMANTTVSDNDASVNGGGIWVDNTSADFSIAQIFNNTATSLGGAAWISTSGSVGLSRAGVTGNSAETGGGVYNDNGDLAASRVLFGSNQATVGSGGAVYNHTNASFSAENSTFSGNTAATSGGGVHNENTILLNNNTFTLNTAGTDGGGLFNSPGLALRIAENNIFSGNTAGSSSPDVANPSTFFTSAYNIYGVNDDGSFAGGTGDQIGADPMLGPLVNNGGETATHDLLCGSAAIDAGDPGSSLTVDQRNEIRPFGGRIDIGAVEKNEVCCSIDSATVGVQGACDPGTNTYTQEITVFYNNAPGTGTLDVNGQSFGIATSPQTVVLSGLNSDGLPADLNVSFSDDLSCTFSELAAWVAPDSCPPCMIDSVSIGVQGACDVITNEYTQELTVFYSNEPGTGNLDVNGQLFAVTGSPQTVVLSGLNSDGLNVDLNVQFSDDPGCTLTSLAAWTAPMSCATCDIMFSVDSVSDCQPIAGLNTYFVDLTLTYSNPPATGSISVNGELFPITGSPQLVSLVDLQSFGNPQDLEVFFTDDTDCSFFQAAAWTDPVPCVDCIRIVPEGLEAEFDTITGNMLLSWTPISNLEGCRLNGRPLGAPVFALAQVLGTPPTQITIASTLLTPGTTYEWKIKCACEVPPGPSDVTDFSELDTFFYPGLPRLGDMESMEEQLSGEIVMQLYPNPTDQGLYLNASNLPSGDVFIEVIDIKGQVHVSTYFEQDAQVPLQVYLSDVSRLAAGAYFVRLTHHDGVITESFFKQD
jgi:hypothetical protein